MSPVPAKGELVFVALGSNLQQPQRQLREAVAALGTLPRSDFQACSHTYRSSAVGPGSQPDYLNAVVRLRSTLPPLDMLDALQAIEDRQGRLRGVRWGARTLDLDLLLYGDYRMDLPRLQLPHPRMHLRNFVLYPLLDVADQKMLLPGAGELGTLVAGCPRQGLQVTDIELES